MKRIRRPKGHEPVYFDDPATERMLQVVLALAAEVSVLRDRLDTHERLAAQHGLYKPADVDAYQAPPAVDAERTAWRMAYLGRVLDAVRDHAGSAETMSEQAYDAVVKSVS